MTRLAWLTLLHVEPFRVRTNPLARYFTSVSISHGQIHPIGLLPHLEILTVHSSFKKAHEDFRVVCEYFSHYNLIRKMIKDVTWRLSA